MVERKIDDLNLALHRLFDATQNGHGPEAVKDGGGDKALGQVPAPGQVLGVVAKPHNSVVEPQKTAREDTEEQTCTHNQDVAGLQERFEAKPDGEQTQRIENCVSEVPRENGSGQESDHRADHHRRCIEQTPAKRDSRYFHRSGRAHAVLILSSFIASPFAANTHCPRS
jgi:hypothetical protein